MIVFTPILESELKEKPSIPKYDGIKMSLEEFLATEFDDQGYKYEWNDGILEAAKKMKENERKIYRNINRRFVQTNAFREGYELIAEADCNLKKLNKLRRPDISIFSKEQIEKPETSQEAPQIAIEILSPSNSIVEEEKKINEYFYSGCKIVWHIFSELKIVKIYSSIKLVRVCTDNDVCNFGDVIPDFQISVNDIFG
ncbi:MAG: Uma2 family endonuclease [Leptospiraceae bacterium]|nr:Uma2 family endonuclease [Leptospiraceae bacterium]